MAADRAVVSLRKILLRAAARVEGGGKVTLPADPPADVGAAGRPFTEINDYRTWRELTPHHWLDTVPTNDIDATKDLAASES